NRIKMVGKPETIHFTGCPTSRWLAASLFTRLAGGDSGVAVWRLPVCGPVPRGSPADAPPAAIVATSRFVVLLTPSPRESRLVALSLQKQARGIAVGGGTSPDATGTLVVGDFDCSSIDETSRQGALQGIEKAVQEEGGRAVMVTSVDPFRLFALA